MNLPTRDEVLLLLNLCTKRPRDDDDDHDGDENEGQKRHCINHISMGVESWTAPLPIIPQTQCIIPQGMALNLVDTVEIVSIKSPSLTEIPLENVSSVGLLVTPPNNKAAEPEPETIKPIIIRRNMVPAHKVSFHALVIDTHAFVLAVYSLVRNRRPTPPSTPGTPSLHTASGSSTSAREPRSSFLRRRPHRARQAFCGWTPLAVFPWTTRPTRPCWRWLTCTQS